MDKTSPRFIELATKTAVSHTLTYFFMGVLAAHFLNYAASMARPESGMRQMNDPLVMAGPLFQPLRGLVFATVFYPLRERLFCRRDGWLVMAWILIGVGILSTFSAATGSIEGMIYTLAPIRFQIRGWLEVVSQALLLSALLTYWINHREKKWLNWLLGVLFIAVVGLLVLGLLVRKANV
jgi:hypothetical protein